MTRDEAPNIHEHVAAICETFGFEPRLVSQMTIEPHHLRLEVYKTNEQGNKYIDQDTGVAALEAHHFVIAA